LRYTVLSVVGCLSDVFGGFWALVVRLLAVKSVWQHYAPTRDVLGLLEVFRKMVNESIRAGLANDASSLRKLSLLSYNQLAQYDSPCCCKLCAISRAAGILSSRKKSLRRRISHQRALYCQTAARVMLRLQDEERRTGDSDRERETSQHTPNQAHAKGHLSARSHCTLPSPGSVDFLVSVALIIK